MEIDPAQLPPLERTLLQATALYYGRVGRTKLMEAARHAGARMPNGKAVSHMGLKPVLDSLVETGLLEDTGNGLRCPRALLETFTDDAMAQGRLETLAQTIRGSTPVRTNWQGQIYYQEYDELIRDLRLALFLGDSARADQLIHSAYAQFSREVAQQHPLQRVDARGIQAPWVADLPPGMREGILLILARAGIPRLDPGPGVLEALAATDWELPEMAREARFRQAEYSLLAGDPEQALHHLGDANSVPALTLKAWAALVAGDLAAAQAGYEYAYQTLRQGTRKRNIYFHDLAGAFSLLPLLAAEDLKNARQRAERAIKDKENPLGNLYSAWLRVIQVRSGEADKYRLLPSTPRSAPPLHKLLFLLTDYWSDPQALTAQLPELESIARQAERAGFHWIAAQARALLARAGGEAPTADTPLPLVDLLRPKEPWEPILDALAAVGEHAATADSSAQSSGASERLVWWLTLEYSGLRIEPRLQKRNKRGGWSAGRNVAMERLYRGEVECLDAADQNICAGIMEEREAWGWGRTSYAFDPNRAWPALVGHPRLFRADDPLQPLELVEAEPELHVKRSKQGLQVTLEPPLPKGGPPLEILEESHRRWRLVRFNEVQRRMGELLREGLECPSTAEPRLRETLGRVAPLVNIHSAIGGGEELPQVEGDIRPHLTLTRWEEGLAAELLVRPLGKDGPGYPPGRGSAESTAAVSDGSRRRLLRDLLGEKRESKALLAACPALEPWEVEPLHWRLPETEAALELLEQLQPLGDQVVVEWPQGQRLSVSPRLDGSSMRLALRRNGDWFAASGQLQVDEDEALELQRLLALIGSGGQRFLPLGEGRFLALTESFRRRLEELRELADSAARKPRYHPLAAPLLEEIGSELGSFETDQAWRERLARLQKAEQARIEVPSTFGAQLRDYQLDGYRWLMRLAQWGVGACLADDMGLGKTVQMLAVLVQRAARGPSLVIAPTSVCANWIAEARRFAPTLNPLLFGPGDRQGQLDALGPFDLLIASYGLMQQEIERLCSRNPWNCLVLDEAQAIKNPATQRAKAATRLPADFRVVTTGTPIENHLGELWSLFRYLNPGLLGSHDAFNRRYALPIERDENHATRERLRRLVRPFILRRLKSAVLEELPPRTEILLQVERSAEENAFYEALRRQIVEQLGNEKLPPEQRRFEVLAGITRLRRAACHPALVAPEAAIPSSKLELFLETVEELRQGRHKALVFSQFVDHLSLVRAALDLRNISYQYLDGATPAKARTQRVQAFQAGEGELFLISLKAGGTGLNLTAADYVIHLDPWWNPAVEDQASDRAHRIGQERPVTIYRLVAKGSIEERIIELHSRKRDLADSLLEGGDTTARLNTEELLALMRGEMG